VSPGSKLSAEAAASLRHPLTRVLLSLTLTTGMIDAVSFLALGRVFTANMTGNVVLLGFGIAGAGGLPVLAPLVSLAAFVVGARVGGLLSARLASRHPIDLGTALVIEVVFTVAASVILAGVDVRPGTVSAGIVIALLAFAMGVRNATVRRIAVPDLPTTVLTTTLTGLAAEFSLRRDGEGDGDAAASTARRAAAVITMFLGALIGALLVKSSPALSAALSAVLVLVTLLAYVPPRWRAAGQPA
jgi:uncharacterized membrane protein YoaK (UPF0700 family)